MTENKAKKLIKKDVLAALEKAEALEREVYQLYCAVLSRKELGFSFLFLSTAYGRACLLTQDLRAQLNGMP